MIRTTGFIIGVCLTLGLLILLAKPDLLQWPSAPTESEIADMHINPAETVATIPDQPGIASAPADPASTSENHPARDLHTGSAEIATDQQTELASPAPATARDIEAGEKPGRSIQAVSMETIVSPTHLFWSPFRSEWAAQGFADRLRVATSVPVEVIQVETGQYRVGFSYRDEDERLALKERIVSITGLELESP